MLFIPPYLVCPVLLFVVVCSVCLLLTLAFCLAPTLSVYFGCISTLYSNYIQLKKLVPFVSKKS